MEENRIADYFIVSGIPETNELGTESRTLTNTTLPITDITVIFRGHGEEPPIGYTCIERTPTGHLADLNNGNIQSPNIQICYRRGDDKPPLVDVGVYCQDRERLLADAEVINFTPYGRCASTGQTGTKSGTYLSYRRAKINKPYSQLVLMDLCVILNNKNEHPPRAFYPIRKNLNRSYFGMIGSEVFLCYKKTRLTPPSICFTPQIISRFPLKDYTNFSLPETVPLFCLPAGASVEARPLTTPLPKPIYTTFVLTSDSALKMYGSSLSFYESHDKSLLNAEQLDKLGLNDANDHELGAFVVKSICILSRWPFFECFEKFLTFLHKRVFTPHYYPSTSNKSAVSIEHYISHFLLDVTFPTPQRPTIVVELLPDEKPDERLEICYLPSNLPLPLTGASFVQLLIRLGVENTMHVLLFGLCEQKILLHSLSPWALTSVAEAITAMLFPFHWQCPYVPLCPLSLHGILNAPLPFIVGIDSRCFDNFTPPDDVICVDLDTRAIFINEQKRCLKARIFPKLAARNLRNSLERIWTKLQRIQQALGTNQSPQHRSPTQDASRQQLYKKFELEIQEAFLRFMATIMRGFRSFLLPITRAPTVGATDPTSLFDFEGFLLSRDRSCSQFYQLLTRTQMFAHYIEERSFVSDKNTSLAFFDDCEERLAASERFFPDKSVRLFDMDNVLTKTDRSVFIPAPEQSPSVSVNTSLNHSTPPEDKALKFGPLNPALFHRHPQISAYPSLDKAFDGAAYFSSQHYSRIMNEQSGKFSMSRRTKQEVKASQKKARRSAELPFDWAKYLVSCCYCLWFSTLPSYVAYCKSPDASAEVSSKTTARILRSAYSTIVWMQRQQLTTDEVCFRVLTLLCGYHGQPALAVRVFFEMKKAGIKPNAVTYGYYNKAVLESQWPDHSSKPTTVLWTKLKNVISGVALFKMHGRSRVERRRCRTLQIIRDSATFNVDVVDRAASTNYSETNDFFVQPAAMPNKSMQSKTIPKEHRRSLVNRSFSTCHKGLIDDNDDAIDDSDDVCVERNTLHKSCSMNIANLDASDRASLSQVKTNSFDDETEDSAAGQKLNNHLDSGQVGRRATTTYDCFSALKERYQLLNKSDNTDIGLVDVISCIDTAAGVLLTTNPHGKQSNCLIRPCDSSKDIVDDLHDNSNQMSNEEKLPHDNFLLKNHHLNNGHNLHISDAKQILLSNSYGEDERILRNLHTDDKQVNNMKPNDSNLDDISSTDDNKSNRLSESTLDQSEDGIEGQDEYAGMLKTITSSTPNSKLVSLTNDASNLIWSKWSASNNSKSVYKGIKSAATGIVSSLQEIKSSFSISNNATPAKLLTSAQHKSTTTREMLTQVANYFSSQPTRDDDYGDSSSSCSNDMFKLSNEEDMELSSAEANEFRTHAKFFTALENHYNTANSSLEDLSDLITEATQQDGGDAQGEKEKVAIEIRMTTCSRCNVCRSLLYDEEIMDKWSHNESNLNTKCAYCRAKIVPLMSITFDDYRFMEADECLADVNKADEQQQEDNLVNLNFDDDAPASSLMHQEQRRRRSSSAIEGSNSPSQRKSYQQNFTVPYLSPIVLRKELESVFESSGDNCPASSRFVDEHPIIFWNLLWYFNRINVPTHLALLCLNSKTFLLGRKVPHNWTNAKRVMVHTLWDNDQLHSDMGKPLYRLLERGDPSERVRSILSDELRFSRSFLDRVIGLIKCNELQGAMSMILNARLKSSTRFSFDKNRHNLYRDLIFLINMSLGPGRLFMDNFEREYKRAFESLNFQQVALNRFDRPPTIGSIFCRKCFKQPSLMELNGQLAHHQGPPTRMVDGVGGVEIS